MLWAKGGKFGGQIEAESGHIGGWTIESGKLTATGDNNKVCAVQAPASNTTWVFAAGGSSHSSYSDCPFRVDKDGKLYASSATISGSVTATSGTIGGCAIQSGVLKVSKTNITSVNASAISAGTVNATTVKFTTSNGYLEVGTDTDHPKVSGLNVGSNAIKLSDQGILLNSYDGGKSTVGALGSNAIKLQAAEINLGTASGNRLTVAGVDAYKSGKGNQSIEYLPGLSLNPKHLVFRNGILVDVTE